MGALNKKIFDCLGIERHGGGSCAVRGCLVLFGCLLAALFAAAITWILLLFAWIPAAVFLSMADGDKDGWEYKAGSIIMISCAAISGFVGLVAALIALPMALSEEQ
jgi:hypothetical protein